MPQIPVYQEKVGLDTGGTPTPRLQGPMESASGVGIAASLEGLAKTVSEGVGEVAHLAAYKQKLDSQEKVDNLTAQAADETQDRLHGKDGFLLRQADAAKGITAGDPGADSIGPVQPGQDALGKGVKYKDSYDGFASELKKKYMAQATNAYEQKMLNHALNHIDRVSRNAVIEHEGQQAKIAREQAHDAAIGAFQNTAVDAVLPNEITNAKGTGLLDRALVQREQALRDAGHTDQDVIAAVQQETANKFADTVVHANLERDPEKAQSMLDAMKGKIGNATAATLQDRVDGKMTSIRSATINKQINEDPKSKNDDGTFNLGYVEQRAAELASTRPAGEQKKLVSMAKEQAQMVDASMVQQKQQATRSYLDGFAELRDKDVPFHEAEKIILSHVAKQYGQVFGAAETDALRLKAVNIYKHSPDAIDARLSVMTADQKHGYADAVNTIKTKYKSATGTLPGESEPVKLSDAMIQELKVIAPKMTRQQMREWVDAGLKNVPTQHAWLSVFSDKFNQVGPGQGMTPAWQVERNAK